MIHQWEMLSYPSEKDPQRYRISLWADAQDMEQLRKLFPGRAGSVWTPQRQPYTSSCFLYKLSSEESQDLEEILSGRKPFPKIHEQVFPVDMTARLSDTEGTHEFQSIDAAADPALAHSGAGACGSDSERTIPLVYVVPEPMARCADFIQESLLHTAREKKVLVRIEKTFVLKYRSLSPSELHRLFSQCLAYRARHILAVGQLIQLTKLAEMAREKNIFFKWVPEEMVSGNFWLTTIAEIISSE